MKEIESIEISKLKFDEDINQLVPEMTEEEFSDLVKSIEEEGQRTPIHINKDNTILDGRHRVRALEELNIKEVSAIKENMSKSEALKFVRDTAVKRRSLNANQKLNIVLNTKDLIDDLQERAKTNQGTRNDLTFSSAEPKVKKTPVHENKEIADLAGVSTSTVMRAKKVKREDPEAYEKVIKENAGWDRAYNNLESIKKKKEAKQKEVAKVETPVKEPEAPNTKNKENSKTEPDKPMDIREKINADTQSVEPEIRKAIKHETSANAFVSALEEIISIHDDEIEDFELFERYLSTLNYKALLQAKEKIENIIKIGGYER
ncbi:ParB N-terminal domain-containing protein [Staphylococcus capitis]|uniref:ParB N-terminal domain-containing protein n=1 Tax=Staphylococcus capitis TaxID=29388 RepID=UPI00066AF9EF|nr:ParB N-terminal domain-containing protein [Staphylococcus capitis]MDS1000227.1 ParB N-terminal domain-containing protein [Staphylococcus capitis]